MDNLLPPKNVAGKGLNSYDDYFVPPVPEIGSLICGDTDCSKDDVRPSESSRLIKSVIYGVIGFLIVFGILYFIDSSGIFKLGLIWKIIISLVPAILVFVITFYETAFNKHVCYVGENGNQWSDAHKSREDVDSRIFLFQNATDLKSEITHKYITGALNQQEYSKTDYKFRWFQNNSGNLKLVYTQTGSHEAGDYQELGAGDFLSNGQVIPSSTYLFAHQTAQAWYSYIKKIKLNDLKVNGFADFDLGDDSRFIRLTPEYIEVLTYKNSVQAQENKNRIDKSNFKGLFKHLRSSLIDPEQQTRIRITGKDYSPKLLGSSGQKIDFKLNQLSNKEVFFELWFTLFGMRFIETDQLPEN